MTTVSGILAYDVRMRGEGLRPILRYARKSPVYRVRVDDAVNVGRVGQYAVTFYFDDGCQSLTYWNDWRVLLDWLLARKSWGVDRVYFAVPGAIDQTDDWHATGKLRKRGTNVVGARALANA